MLEKMLNELLKKYELKIIPEMSPKTGKGVCMIVKPTVDHNFSIIAELQIEDGETNDIVIHSKEMEALKDCCTLNNVYRAEEFYCDIFTIVRSAYIYY